MSQPVGTFEGFGKDILLLDFESTGFTRDETTGDVSDPGYPTQLGAVLLDYKTLEEKDHFLSDIKADPDRLDAWVLKNTDITRERVSNAPEPAIVAQQFVDQFGTEPFLATWNIVFDRYWLDQLMHSIDRGEAMYDYHHLDVWSLTYTYLCEHGHPDIIQTQATFRLFGQSDRSVHNALDDCRRTAEVLRAVIFNTGIPS